MKRLWESSRALVFLLLVLPFFTSAQESPLWMRYPAISPDGSSILFSYKGDIYKVSSTGGTAIPLTLSDSYEFSPVWSHDGKSIAFASDRYGSLNVFVMPAMGGEAKRLTYHSSSGEVPSSFTSDDKEVLFYTSRQDPVTNAQFPTPGMGELYSVPVSGGRVDQVLPVPAIGAVMNSRGDKLLFEDLKGYESDWRKHHTSWVTRDIWSYDRKTSTYSKLTTFEGEDKNPVFDANDQDFYYLSEQGGSFNVYKSSLTDPSHPVALTHFSKNPVRFLTRANDNTLCFGYDGEIYVSHPGSEPQKVAIRVAEDGLSGLPKVLPVNGGVTEMKLSPNGKEIAFVFRGEIFVTSVTGGITKRITNTSWQERSVSFSPDGRSLLFAAEKNNNWNIYTLSIGRKEEPYFFASTVLKEETVIATPAEEFQPAYSPDGKEVAYLENRTTLKVVNLATRQSRTVLSADKNYSYSDGDQYYQWSPDSKWLLVQYGPPERVMTPEVGLIAADGKSPVINLTLSGYSDYNAKWGMGGKVMIWGSDRNGARAQGGYTLTGDVFAMFFTRDAFDRFKLSKEDFALLKEIEEKKEKDKKEAEAKKGDKKNAKDTAKNKKDSAAKEIKFDWDNLTERKIRLTTHTSDAQDWLLSPDGEKLYYLTHFEKGYDLWVTENRTKDTKLFAKLGAQFASMELSPDGKSIFVLAEGKITKIDAESGKMDGVGINGEMVLNDAGERDYIFEHVWRQIKEKFYVVDMNGVDWDYYHTTYKKFLPYINNDFDFAEMLSEMLGELNASHTGCYYIGNAPSGGDRTAALGVFYDYAYKGPGLKIQEVITGSPLDRDAEKVKPGVILEKIDGMPITDTVDHYQYLNRTAGKLMLLSFYDPATRVRWDETIKPISLREENELLYKRWVNLRRKETDSLSKGRIGYIHVRAMDDESMRTVFEEALGRDIGKDAIIVDTRWNGGGNIHEQLSDFLNGKKYFDIIPHGQYVGSEPYDKWTKPSIVLIGEANYSDAHLFPAAYKLKNIGKTLGMPVAGTGTFVWWEVQIDPNLVFGMPMGGWRAPNGRFEEGQQLEPDIKVRDEPATLSGGRDQQIEEAVKELMKKQ